ncbi:MAG: ABC transporter ATP-binding protein [Rhodobacter sp.]|jgi:biotin transport system ATP-binding protein|nr:ABC transporter ATP-binding protein [Rhodobacter sp.]MBK8439837.1 ABC transporter ATP-binding protein [Rhodobacter sp.]
MSGIRLQDAGHGVAGKVILSGLDLHLTEARIGIVGRNGSGKTTLLRLIAGLVAPTTGTVRLDGIDPFHDRKGTLARLGILFQNPDHQILFPTVEEELAFGLRQQGQAQAQALEAARAALQAEGRGHWAGAAVATLSGGQRHWLCLQAVLMMRPATILLDEPFAGLDLPTIARMIRRLAALPQRLITISHEPAAVAGADRVIWLEAGRVAADGPPAEVLPAFTAEMARIGGTDADADLAG